MKIQIHNNTMVEVYMEGYDKIDTVRKLDMMMM